MPNEQIKTNEHVEHAKHVLHTKKVTIKHHHAKAYRKRHLASFLLLFIAGSLLIAAAIRYNKQVQSGVANAKKFVADVFAPKKVLNQTIESTYGYSLTYDTQKFYATAIDSNTGELFIGTELTVRRPYETVRIAQTMVDAKAENSNMTVHFYPKTVVADTKNLAAIEATAIKDLTSKATLQAKKVGTSNVVYNGKELLKTEWQFQSNSKILAGFIPSFTTYTTVVGDKAMVIEIVDSSFSVQKYNPYEEILQSLYFGGVQTTYVAPETPEHTANINRSRTLLDTALFSGAAWAQEASIPTSEQVSAAYGPAVVKIFNAYCQDIYFDGKSVIKDLCNGTTGSGFFVNESGYIASNGHVVNSDPKDLLISVAYDFYRKGDTRLLDFLSVQAKITAADLPNGTGQERADYLFNKLYAIDNTRVTTQNSTINLLVCLGKDQPDVKELLSITAKREQYPEQATIKRAKLISEDFRSFDGVTKFHASDVAIIKVEGSNFPATKLGTLTGLMQGANLNILGFPGNASQNGIVDAGQSTVSLTSGKVSAIKNALGSDKKLIETDTTIGHGNSGGPAFNDKGEVMGISTYTAAKVGDGTYNYIRDIKDLVDLASVSAVALGKVGKTQTEWEVALAQFNSAHYSKSLKGFEAVKKLYPAHPSADTFIAAANENIKAGKDVKDFPLIVVIAGGVVLLIGAGLVVRIIVRHKRTHNVYKTHVTTGLMEPLAKGDPAVSVAYDPAHIAAQKNVLTAERTYATPVEEPTQVSE